MPNPSIRPPKIRRQREKPPRPDRAYVTIGGKRHQLGIYGSPESYKRYAELIHPEAKAQLGKLFW